MKTSEGNNHLVNTETGISTLWKSEEVRTENHFFCLLGTPGSRKVLIRLLLDEEEVFRCILDSCQPHKIPVGW